jgi:hypothetical protein
VLRSTRRPVWERRLRGRRRKAGTEGCQPVRGTRDQRTAVKIGMPASRHSAASTEPSSRRRAAMASRSKGVSSLMGKRRTRPTQRARKARIATGQVKTSQSKYVIRSPPASTMRSTVTTLTTAAGRIEIPRASLRRRDRAGVASHRWETHGGRTPRPPRPVAAWRHGSRLMGRTPLVPSGLREARRDQGEGPQRPRDRGRPPV